MSIQTAIRKAASDLRTYAEKNPDDIDTPELRRLTDAAQRLEGSANGPVLEAFRAGTDAVGDLGAWLTDNTVYVFEEVGEVDAIRTELDEALEQSL